MNDKYDIDRYYDKWRLIILGTSAFLLVLIYAGNIFYQNQKYQSNEPRHKMVIQFNDGRSITLYEKSRTAAMEDWDSFDSGLKSETRYSK